MSNVLKLGKKILTIGTVFSTILWSVGVAALLPAVAQADTCPTFQSGDMFKVSGASAIYAVDSNGKVEYFPDGNVFKSWTADNKYGGYTTISQACYDTMPVASQGVGYRPGSYIVKRPSSSQLYVVEPNDMLATITPDAATALYGANYKVMTVLDTNWPTYGDGTVRGAAITEAVPHVGMLVSDTSGNIWYVDANNTLDQVTPTGFTANRFQNAFVHPVTSAETTGFTTGTTINALVPAISDRTQTGGVMGAAPVSTGGTSTSTVAVSSGSVSVSLAADNPAGGNVPVDGPGEFPLAKVLSLNFTAGATPVVVTGLNVTRAGLSSDSDLDNVFLMSGNTVIATNLGISNGVINFNSGAGLFTVPANSTMEVSVAVNIDQSAVGHTYNFGLATAQAVTSETNASVSGSFPVMGNTLTSSQVSNLGGIAIINSSAGTTAPGLTVNAGQTMFNVGQFSVQAQNQAVQVQSITLTETGSTAPTDVDNIKLYNGGTLVGTASGIGANNTAVFNLTANPIQLTSGQTALFYVYADVPGGVNRYFQFSVQHQYDIVAKDMMFGFNFLPTITSGGSGTGTSWPLNMSYVTVQAGSLTVTRDANSAINNYLPGGTNQALATFDLQAAGEAVRVTALTADLGTNGGAASYGSPIAPGSLSNFKIVDDQGQQIGTTLSGALTALYGVTGMAPSNLNYIIPANTTRKVTIYADVGANATGNIEAELGAITAQGFVSLADASVSAFQTGNLLTNSGGLLNAYQNNSLATANVVSGQTAAHIASFALTAGSASAVNVYNITLSTNSAAPTDFQNLKLMDGTTQIGNVQGTLTYPQSIVFTASSPISLAAGQQVTLDVYADVKTGISTGTISGGAVSLAANGISASAVATNQTITSVTGDTTALAGQDVEVNSAGTLTYNLYQTPNGAQIGMGTQGVILASYKLVGSANEDITANNFYLIVTSTPSAFTNFRLINASTGVQYGCSAGQTTCSGLSLSGTTGSQTSSLEWSGLGIDVPQNGSVNFNVVADANTWGAIRPTNAETATTNAQAVAGIYRVDFTTNASKMASNYEAPSYSSNLFNVLQTTLGAASANAGANAPAGSTWSYASNLTNGAIVGAYTFTAGSGADAVLNVVSTTVIFSGYTVASSTMPVTYYLVDASNGNTVASVTSSPVSGNTVVFTLGTTVAGGTNNATNGGLNGAAGLVIPQNGTKTFLIKADLGSNFTEQSSSGVKGSFQTILGNWQWADNSTGTQVRQGLYADSSFSLPYNGTSVNL